MTLLINVSFKPCKVCLAIFHAYFIPFVSLSFSFSLMLVYTLKLCCFISVQFWLALSKQAPQLVWTCQHNSKSPSALSCTNKKNKSFHMCNCKNFEWIMFWWTITTSLHFFFFFLKLCFISAIFCFNLLFPIWCPGYP